MLIKLDSASSAYPDSYRDPAFSAVIFFKIYYNKN
jgi:hypothetical protein